MKEERFWLTLAEVCGALAVVQLPFTPSRFGGLFFVLLGVGCAGEWALMHYGAEQKQCVMIAIVGRILFGIFVISFAFVQIFVIQRGAYSNADEADYVLVLGALVNPDGNPSAVLAARCDTAAVFLEEHLGTKAVLCGAQGPDEPMTEAESMYKYLVKKGVDPGRLIKEDESSNTIENIENAQKFLSPGDTVAIITSDYHLARARMLLRSAGLGSAGIPAPTPHPGQWLSVRCREYCSIIGLVVSGRWKM